MPPPVHPATITAIQMADSRPYRVRDALLGLFVGLWLVILPGFGLYALATETVGCRRTSGDVVACSVVRRVAGIPVRSLEMPSVRAVTLEREYSAPRYVLGRRNDGGSTYSVRYVSDHEAHDGIGRPAATELEPIVAGIMALIERQAAGPFEATVGGGPLLWRLALWVLFVVGVLCLVNIPFAAVAELRARRTRV